MAIRQAALRALARQHQALTVELDALRAQLDTLTVEVNPALRAAKGVGVDVASILLIAAGRAGDLRRGTDHPRQGRPSTHPRRRGRLGSAGLGKDPPMSAHIIGRPNDDVLDILLGHGVDPEQAFIGVREQGLEEGDGSEDRLLGEEPTVPEQ